jgi:DNA-binding transcriptional ArsR family regulator
MITNMKSSPYQQIGALLEALGSPVRIQILLAIGAGEACVCHLESLLGLRQAYISQQLMDLREKGIVTSRREGKFIYHRLEKPEILDLVRLAAHVAGVAEAELALHAHPGCECPHCQQEGCNETLNAQT